MCTYIETQLKEKGKTGMGCMDRLMTDIRYKLYPLPVCVNLQEMIVERLARSSCISMNKCACMGEKTFYCVIDTLNRKGSERWRERAAERKEEKGTKLINLMILIVRQEKL